MTYLWCCTLEELFQKLGKLEGSLTQLLSFSHSGLEQGKLAFAVLQTLLIAKSLQPIEFQAVRRYW